MAEPLDITLTIRNLSNQVALKQVEPKVLKEAIVEQMKVDSTFREIIIQSYQSFSLKTV